jgi:pimeloyl-ACP methyl ester carboxylesterase
MDFFERDGLRFPVLDSGDSSGPAVVLLHGFPQLPSSFSGVLPRLHEAGLRTLAPTARGYAPACRPLQRREYASSETAADVIALLDAAGIDRAHLVGHDWGGFQAWAAASAYPERIATLTVLSTPHPAALLWSFRHSRQALKSWYMGLIQLPLLPELLAGRTLGRSLSSSGLPDADVAVYTEAMARPGALSGALNWYRGMPFADPATSRRITIPTTYVWGRNDFALGRAAAEKTADFVDGPYRFLELDAGHWLPEREPAAVAEAVLDRIG